MKEMVEHIAKSLVADTSAVTVTEEEKEGYVQLDLKVASDDMGKVIGKQGRIAKAIRTVIKAAAIKDGKKYNMDIS